MRFTITSVLALAATSTAAVLPRADYGYWDFTGSASYPVSGYNSYKVDATYHNSELEAPIAVTCSYLYNPQTKTETASCSDPSFTYDFGGVRQANTVATVTLTQTVELWGSNVTVKGAKEFDFDFSGGAGFTGTASGEIDAQTATA